MTADPETDFPPEEFVFEPGVALIDEHEGARTHKGKALKVDAAMLERIAANQNDIYKHKKCPVFVGLGHTKDGEHVSETDQPPIVAYATNLRVEPFRTTGKRALFADLHFKREHQSAIRDYPGRSVELYPESEEIPFLALLRKVPERNLPVIKFSARPTEDCYHYSLPDNLTLHFSKETVPPMDKTNPALDADPAVADAQLGQGKEVQEIKAELAQVKALLQSFMSMVQEASVPEDEDQSDLLGPADDADEFEDDDKEPEQEPEEKEEPKGKADDKPVKMDASQPTATNCNVPTTEKEPVKMARDAESLKFERETAAKFARLEREKEELRIKYNRIKAEKTLNEWKVKDRIQFPSPEAEAEEVELMAHLDDESFAAHEKRAKLLYHRETPNGEAVREVNKFSRVPEAAVEKTMADIQKGFDQADAEGVDYKTWLSRSGKK